MRILSIILLVVVACVVLFFVGVSRAPDMLSNNLSKKLGVAVSIDSMSFGLDEIEVRELEIGNPKGYSLPKAFSAEEIEIEAPLTQYFSDDIMIEEVEVTDIYLGLEFNSPTSADGNWKTILETFQKNASLDKDGKQEVTIKKLVFRNINTELLFRGGKVQRLPMINEIVLYDISTKGGFPTDQLLGSVLGQMIKQVFLRQNMQNLLREFVFDKPGDSVDNFLKPFEGLLNYQENLPGCETIKHLDSA